MKTTLIQNNLLNDIDIHFANHICRIQDNSSDDNLWLLTALLSYFINHGDSAFNPEGIVGQSLADIFDISSPEQRKQLEKVVVKPFNIYMLEKNSKVIGKPGESKSIIFDGKLFYLNKFFQYEQTIAEFIKNRLNLQEEIIPLKNEINKLFPDNFINGDIQNGINWQKVAGILALNSAFAVICGGPGTGKTTTAGKILTLLLHRTPDLVIKMVAPTGKAVDRLKESIRTFKEHHTNKIDSNILNKIPEEAETIHKFLGIFSHKNKISKYSPAPIDLLLIDEASMVSLPLFAKTFEALPKNCRVILLGDKDQLMAVESGNVLKDITDADNLNEFSAKFAEIVSQLTDEKIILSKTADSGTLIQDVAIQLEHSWRFDTKSGIGHLSKAVNCADASTSMESLLNIIDTFDDIQLLEKSTKDEINQYIQELCRKELLDYQIGLKSNNIKEMFNLLSKFRILCAVNKGPFGVAEINNTIEKFLFPNAIPNSFYPGRPIMITKNDYRLGVMNGDVGILKESNGELKAFFPAEDGTYKRINPSSLDEYTTAFAISIHKSQGSEFDNIFIILPPEKIKILTKELIYTAITRAKTNCSIVSIKENFHQAAITKMFRQSGLHSKIATNSFMVNSPK